MLFNWFFSLKKVNENFILLKKFFSKFIFLWKFKKSNKKNSTFKYILVVYICSEQKNLIPANCFNRAANTSILILIFVWQWTNDCVAFTLTFSKCKNQIVNWFFNVQNKKCKLYKIFGRDYKSRVDCGLPNYTQSPVLKSLSSRNFFIASIHKSSMTCNSHIHFLIILK